MAVTTNTDVVIPQQVVADIAVDILFKSTPLLASGAVFDLTQFATNAGGENITLRTFDTELGNVQNAVRTQRAGVEPSKVSMDSYVETLHTKVTSFDADRFALIDANAGVYDHMAQVAAREIGASIQDLLIDKALGTDLWFDSSTLTSKTLTVRSILAAKMKWGDRATGAPATLFVTSEQYEDLASSDDYLSLGSAARGMFVGTAGSGTEEAVVHGCRVMVMDGLPKQDFTISGITRSSAVATVTTAAAHGLTTGDLVTLSGATQAEYNGTFAVASTPTATTFTYAVSGSPDTPATGTPVLTPRHTALLCRDASLGLYLKLLNEHVTIFHAGSSVVTLDFHSRFAGTLWRSRPRGVVKLTTRVS